jgi:hypothetical protein
MSNELDDIKSAIAEGQAKTQSLPKYARPGPYSTPLSGDEESKFQGWIKDNNVPFEDDGPKSNYDMRGYWKDIASKGKSETSINPNDNQMHFPDTYKTPYHKTFSNESKYATSDAPHWANDHQLVDKGGKVVFDEKAEAASQPGDELADIKAAIAEGQQKTQNPIQMLYGAATKYGKAMKQESRHGKTAAAGALAGIGGGLANFADIIPDIAGGLQKQITSPEVYQAMAKHGLVAGGSPLTTAYEKLHPVAKAKRESPAFYGTTATVAPMAIPVGGGEQAGARIMQAAGNLPIVGGAARMADALVRMAPGVIGRTAYAAVGNVPLATALATNDLARAKKALTPENIVTAAAPYIGIGTVLHGLGEVGFSMAARGARRKIAAAQLEQEKAGAYQIQPPPRPVSTGEQFRQQNRSVITPPREAAPAINPTEGVGARKIPLSAEEARAKFNEDSKKVVTGQVLPKSPATEELKAQTEALPEPKNRQVDYGDREQKLAAIKEQSVEAPPLESLGEKAAKAKEVLNNLAMKARSINDQEEKVRAWAKAINTLLRTRGQQPNAEFNKDITLTEDANAAAESGVRGFKKTPNTSYVETVPHEGSAGVSAAEQGKINRALAKPEAPTELAKGFAQAHDRLQSLEKEKETYRAENEDILHEAVPFGTHLTEGETTFHHKQDWRNATGTKSEKAASAIVSQRKAQAAENPENIAYVRDSRYQKMHLNKQYQTSLEMLKGKVPEEEYRAWEQGLNFLKRGRTSGQALSAFEPFTPAIAKAAQFVGKKAKQLTVEDGLRLTGTFHNFDIYKRYDPALFKSMQEKVAQLVQVSGGERMPANAMERQLFKNSTQMDYEDILTGKKGMDQLDMPTREYLTRRNAILDDMRETLKARQEALYGKDAKFHNWNFFTDKALGLAIQKDLEQLSGRGFSAPGLDGIFSSIVQGRVQVGEQHLLEALIINTANDPKAMAGLMKAVKEDPRIWEFTKMYQGGGPLRDAYESAMESGNPLRQWWVETDRKINGPWMSRMADMLGKEHAETLKGIMSNSTPERFKGQVTRAIALTNTAKEMNMKPGELAQLLMDDAASFKNLGRGMQLSSDNAARALEAHISIANEMYERLGWGAPGYRHLGIFQYLPGAVYAAPFKIQAVNQSAAMNRMWMRTLDAVKNKDMDGASQQFRKLMTYTALNATLLGPKAIPKELLAAMSFAAPGFTKEVINAAQKMAFVGHILNTEPTHLQPAIAPIAQVNPSFIKDAYKIYEHYTGQEKQGEPKTDEERQARVKREIHYALFTAAAAGFSTVLDSTMGTEETFNILNHLYEGAKGMRTAWAFSGEPMSTFLAKKKETTNLVENLYHAFVPGERPEDERFIEQMNNNYAAKLHVQWLYPAEFKTIEARAKAYEASPKLGMKLPKGVAAQLNAQRKEKQERTPVRSFDWVDAANRLDSGRLHGIWNFITGHHKGGLGA